jgi:hypothetical protein
MPHQKDEHKNWITSHTDDIVDVLRKGPHFAASFKDRDAIFVVIPALPDGSLIMGETYRAILDEVSTEFPYGYPIEGESPTETTSRIATSQVHALSEYPTSLGEVFPAPGLIDTKIYLYSARVAPFAVDKIKAKGDMLNLRVMSIQEITETIAKGGINDAVTVCSLMKYLTRAKEGSDPLPTRIQEIEILDRHDTVLSTIQTNKPEWSFIEYSKGESRAHEWRFHKVERSEVPSTHPIVSGTSGAPGFSSNPLSGNPNRLTFPKHSDDDVELIPEPKRELNLSEIDHPGTPPSFLRSSSPTPIQDREGSKLEFKHSGGNPLPIKNIDHDKIKVNEKIGRRLNLSMPVKNTPEMFYRTDPKPEPVLDSSDRPFGSHFESQNNNNMTPGFIRRTMSRIQRATEPRAELEDEPTFEPLSGAYTPKDDPFNPPDEDRSQSSFFIPGRHRGDFQSD